VLAPEQTTANNPNRCFNWFQPGDTRRGGGEAASIAGMVTRLTAEHGLDPARVYVTGLSAGGAMAATLLATYPELFAAGGIVAGLPHGAAASMPEAFEAMRQPRGHGPIGWGDRVRAASGHDGPWPTVSVWHGEADGTVAAANGEASVRQWLNVHGLSGAPDAAETTGAHTMRRWKDASGRVVVEQHVLAGLGHGVPLATRGAEGVGAAGPFLLEAGVSSSLTLARSWGLVGEARETAAQSASARTGEVARRPAARPKVDAVFGAPEPPRGRSAGGVAEVINRALAAAGLLK
jgi:poly(hydroxyalkanoate) depolymerase family esterase